MLALAQLALVITGCSCEQNGATADAAARDARSPCVWDKPETCRIETGVKIKWKLSIPCDCQPGGPSVGPKGTIYFAVGGKFTLGSELYAVAPSGKIKWKRLLKGLAENDLCYTPVVDPDGAVYVTSDDGYLHRFSPDGKLQWTLRFDGPFEPWDPERRIAARPVVSSTGEIYVVAADKQVYAVDAKGKVRWRYRMQHLGTWSEVDPVLADGRLFVPVRSPPQIIALNVTDGKALWKRELDTYIGNVGVLGRLLSPQAVNGQLHVAVFHSSAVFVALSQSTGKDVWHHSLPTAPFAGPAGPLFVGPDGDMYAFVISLKKPPYDDSFTYLQSLSKTGKPLFQAFYSKTEPYTTWSRGPLGADGELYAVAFGNSVYKDGKLVTPQRLISYSVHERRYKTQLDLTDYRLSPSSPALLPDGTLLFFTADDGEGAGNTHLIAVQTRSAGLARSGWPKDGHDNRNSGDVSTPLFD